MQKPCFLFGLTWAAAVGLSLSASAMAQDSLPSCDNLFPSALSTGPDGRVVLNGNPDIYGTDQGALVTPSLTDNGAPINCDQYECYATGSSARQLDFPSGLDCSEPLILEDKGKGSSYSLNAGQDYCFSQLRASGKNELIVDGQGTVNLYIDGTVQISGQVRVNENGSPNQLLLMSNGSVQHSGSKKGAFNAFLYSQSTIDISGNTTFNGRLHADTQITLSGTPEIFTGTDKTGICSEDAGDAYTVNHYQIDHSGSGLNCQSYDVQVTACGEAYPDCGPVDVEMAELDLSVDGSDDAFAKARIEDHHTVTAQLDVPNAGEDYTLVAGNPQGEGVKDSNVYYCSGGTGPNGCGFSMDAAGLSFSQEANQLAGQPFELKLEAACGDTITNEDRQVDFKLSCVNPGQCLTPMEHIDSGAQFQTQYTTVTLSFGGSGQAPVALNYHDVGQIRLEARLEADTGAVLTGQSDLFVVAPYQIAVEGVNSEGNNPALGIANDLHNVSPFAMAGESFTLRMSAQSASGQVTPNFGNEDQPEALVVGSHALIAPQAGQDGSLSAPLSPQGDGVFVTNGASYSDVGVIQIQGNVQGAAYLTYDNPIPQARRTSGNIGRFVPAYLDVTLNAPAFEDYSPGSFNYFAEEVLLDATPTFTITAKSTSGSTTNNYHGDFWKLAGFNVSACETTTDDIGVTDDDHSAISCSLNSAMSGTDDGSFNGTGEYSLSLNGLKYERDDTNLAPITPELTLTALASALTDADGVCYQIDGNGSCQPQSVTIPGAQMRHGRAVMQNAYGPTGEPLELPLQIEYYDGSRWVVNQDDYTTAYDSDDLSLAEALTKQSVSGIVAAGRAPAAESFVIAAFDEGHESVAQWDVPAFLEYDWDGDGNHDDDPAADVRFGLYRSSDRVINWREVDEQEQDEQN